MLMSWESPELLVLANQLANLWLARMHQLICFFSSQELALLLGSLELHLLS